MHKPRGFVKRIADVNLLFFKGFMNSVYFPRSTVPICWSYLFLYD